ncbi:MAG: hypothetical protein A2Y07_01975 [Planctomycetes bacterium GWF2_50_10]|nr:MAG: hypothetical protein A2Y07_01975 [Planctomycetes bacterium GWF2_50_10]
MKQKEDLLDLTVDVKSDKPIILPKTWLKLPKFEKPKNKWVVRGIIAGVVAVAILCVVLFPTNRDKGMGQIQFHTVNKGDLLVSVTESGSVKAKDAVEIKSQVEGGTTLISIVPEGTFITEADVASGKILVELDTSELQKRITQQEISFANEESSYTDAKEDYNIRLKQNESDINTDQQGVKFTMMDMQKYLGESVAASLIGAHEKARLSIVPLAQALVIFAPIELEELLDLKIIRKLLLDPDKPVKTYNVASLAFDVNLGGDALQKKRTLEAKIDLANEEFKRAKDQLDWTEKLFAKQYASRGNLEADQLAAKRKSIELDQAKTELDLFLRYEFPKMAEDTLGKYTESQMKLERTYSEARSKLTQSVTKLRSSEATYELQKNELAKLYRQFEACTIRAPKAGLVVYANTGDSWRAREPMEAGASIRERQLILSLPNTAEMAVEMKVHESNVDKVKVGLPTRISIDAFPDVALTGEVFKISLLPDQTRSFLNPDLKVYATDVSIDGDNDFLKPGMSAKVEVIIQELEDVITVPVQAVINRGGTRYCYVQKGKGLEERKIKTGAFNDVSIEVQNGLAAGERVALNPPRSMTNDTPNMPVRSAATPRVRRNMVRMAR